MASTGGPLKILVVDDDTIARRALERALTTEPRLQARGVTVTAAADGRKAIAALEQDLPDVVITDLFMPKMDGFALCRALRRSPRTEALPIIVVSGVYKEQALVADFQQEVLAEFTPKPVKPDALADLVFKLVAMHAAGGAGAAAAGAGSLMAGSLAERSIPSLLMGHLEAGSTGTILLMRGQQRKELFLREGRTVGAESNMRQEALGALLVSRGVIDEDQLNFLLAESKRRGLKMGALLVELGWLSPEEVLRFLGAQARKRVADCLRWNEGTYTFIPGDQFNERIIEHDFDVVRLMFTALQRTCSVDGVLQTLESSRDAPVRLQAPRFERHRPAFEAVFGGALTHLLLTESPSVGALLQRSEAAALVPGLEALMMTGLIQLTRSDAPPTWSPAESSDAFSLERLGEASAHSSANLPDLSEEFLAPSLDAMDALGRGAAPSAAMEIQDSGVVSMDTPSLTMALPSLVSSEDQKQIIYREYLGVHGKSHYEVLGVSPQARREEIIEAYERKSARFAPEAFASDETVTELSKLNALAAAYDRAFRVLMDPELRREYDSTQASNVVDGDALGAELAFNDGLARLHEGRFEDAVARFEQAVSERTDQAVYHAFLGWALYQARGAETLTQARRDLEHAIALDPELVEARVFLGRVARDAGDLATARASLEKALELDPTRADALDVLVAIYNEAGEHQASERLYRHVIRALGERALGLRRRLWRELAELHEREFNDRASARIAYDMAARLAPDDLDLQRKVVELNASDLGRWRDLFRALAAQWRLQPDDPAVGSTMVDLLLQVGQNDGATLAAAALVLRGSDSSETVQLAESHRPRLLSRLAGPLPPAALARARHPGEDTEFEALFTLLADRGLLPPFLDMDIGIEAREELETERLPDAFARVLRYVCGVLNVTPPARLYTHASLGMDARVADTRPHALLIGPALVESSDTVELGFRLGRALSFSSPGRIAGSSRSGRQLKPYLSATLAMARRTLALGDPTADEIRHRLESSPAEVRAQLFELGSKLLRDRNRLNLSAWNRALSRSADRIALLICGDLLRVGRAVAEEQGPEALDELLDFALSLDHIDLRQELGIAPVV